MIPAWKAKEILDDCAALGVKAIQFTGGGEPTVHPYHLELIQHALDLGLECALVTNGYLLRKGWDEVFPRLAWMRVSLDAGSPEVYARVRNVSLMSYQKTLDNMAHIGAVLRDANSKCVYGAGYVITRENYGDIARGVRAIRNTGAHYVRLTAMFSKEYNSYYDGLGRTIEAGIETAKDLETPEFRVIDLYGDRVADLEQQRPDFPLCGYQYFTTFIGANQKVYRCCNTAYTQLGEVGDITKQRFSDFMASADREALYKDFNAHSCAVCQFNRQNRVINYLVGDEPTHVNFV
jgi:MoaA/NifB/PqqE/SkfB family radical SAM enzyme